MKRIILLLLLCTSCSNQSIYNAAQVSRRNQCMLEPTPRYYQECVARTRMSYAEYERQWQESLAAAKSRATIRP